MATSHSEPSAAARWLRFLPSPMALLVLVAGGILAAVTAAKGLRDPDYYWHVSVGQLIAESGSIPTTDPFSFTWEGLPWTLHEWLSELVMFGLVELVGVAGALVLFGLLPMAIFAVLAALLARRGVGVLAFALPVVIVALVLAPYVTIRPQAFSWLFLAVLLLILDGLRASQPARVLWLTPLFVLWANVHGVYVIGLGVVLTWLLFTLIGRTPMSDAKGWALAGSACALLASMVTPAGPIGILYPLRYVDAGDWGLANIQEWQSPSFHDPAHLAFLALIVLVGLNGGRRTPGWLVMLSWVGIAMGLIALRNAPIAAILSLPTLALGLDDRLRSRRAATSARRPMPLNTQLARRMMEIVVASLVVVGAAVILTPGSVPDGDPESADDRFPRAGVEALRAYDADSRVLTEYGWGGYVIHELHEAGGRVFVDGRNDMYDQQILEAYSAIRSADDGWERLVDSYGVETLLLSPSAPLVRGLAQDAGWCELMRDERQVLLARECAAP